MNLKELMEEKDLSIKEVSEKSSVGYHTLQKYLKNGRGLTIENAKKLGKALGFNWWELFEDD